MTVFTQFDLSGKTAVVTGYKRGISRDRAVGLVEAGADIIGVSASLKPTGNTVEQDVSEAASYVHGAIVMVGRRLDGAVNF